MSASVTKRYTAEEDKVIIEKIEQALSEGRSLPPVFEELAGELDRTAIALNYRYYNVLKKKMDSDEQLSFLEEDYKRSTYNAWTPEQDERLAELVEIAESEGIPLSAVFNKFGEETDRHEKSVSTHYYTVVKRKQRDDEGDEGDEDDNNSKGVLSRIKALVKERDTFKQKYEALKKESEFKLSNYDKMARELRQIRKLLE